MHSILMVAAHLDRLQAAAASGAGIVVADLLSGSGPPGARRAAVAGWLRWASAHGRDPALFVRLHPLDGGMIEDDLDGLCRGRPDGLLLACPTGARDLQRLGAKLAVREAEHGLADGSIGILAAVDCASAVMALGSCPDASRRLRGIVWDAEALAGDIGLSSQDLDTAPLRHGRAMVVLAARAAGVPAIEAISTSRDRGVIEACTLGRRDGFAGGLTRDPADVAAVDLAYRGGGGA